MSRSRLLDGKSVLITGGTRGIGRAVAASFAENGAVVFVNGRDADRTRDAAEALRTETGGDVRPCAFDVTDSAATQKAIVAAGKDAGRLDVMVANAGVMHGAMVAMSSDTLLRDTLSINVEGAFYSTRIAARLMMRQKSGSIVMMSSIIGRVGTEGYAAYAASKAALLGMTLSLSKELAPSGIRVNAIAPGFIETDLTSDITGERRDKVLSQIRMGRAGTPQDVANAALFFASDLSCYVTGQTLGVDGSMST